MNKLLTQMKRKPSSSIYFSWVFSIQKYQKLRTSSILKKKILIALIFQKKEVESILNKLDTSKANGPDDINNLFPKNLSKTISRSLLLLFQTFINKGKFPAYWKQSDITPIHKEGDKAAINMYGPINYLCCLSKVFEKLMLNKLYEHVKGTTFSKYSNQRSASKFINYSNVMLSRQSVQRSRLNCTWWTFRFLPRFPESVRYSTPPQRCCKTVGIRDREKALRLIAN